MRDTARLIRSLAFVVAATTSTLSLAPASHAQVNVPPASEQAFLGALFEQTKGPTWVHKAGWSVNGVTDCSAYGIVCDPAGHVTEINLDWNGLRGSLPSPRNLTSLRALRLPGNYGLGGAIPALPSSLVVLDVSTNHFTGSIPTLPNSLTFFDASHNQLTGPIPTLGPSLVEFRVGSNHLDGPLPAFPDSLQLFGATHNQITGAIPAFPGSLTAFGADNNQLSGGIPAFPESLVAFSARSNRLSGPIPALPPSLWYFAAPDNQLTGAIPALPQTLREFFVFHNQLTGSIPALPEALMSLDVSENRLVGAVPTLSRDMVRIRVAFNHLSGTLPAAPPPFPGHSSLCPNALEPIDDVAWDYATSVFPWHRDCSPTYLAYGVTPDAGANGTLVPSYPQTVVPNGTTSFVVTPDNGFAIETITGCGGTLSGDTYTTDSIVADCTVSATFSRPVASVVAVPVLSRWGIVVLVTSLALLAVLKIKPYDTA